MPLAGEIVAEEHLAGVESPRFAIMVTTSPSPDRTMTM
jgi:hypothetical protein